MIITRTSMRTSNAQRQSTFILSNHSDNAEGKFPLLLLEYELSHSLRKPSVVSTEMEKVMVYNFSVPLLSICLEKCSHMPRRRLIQEHLLQHLFALEKCECLKYSLPSIRSTAISNREYYTAVKKKVDLRTKVINSPDYYISLPRNSTFVLKLNNHLCYEI